MCPKKSTRKEKLKRSRLGILLGIPFLLFISGIILLSVSFYNQLSYAFYLSNLFIHDEYKPSAQSLDVAGNETLTETDNGIVKPQKIKFPRLGEKYGDLIIDSISLNYPVFHGDRDKDLVKGIGHYNGSRFPGEGGNVVLSGHNNTVFASLENIEVGDKVVFETTYGTYEYKVLDIRITNKNDKTIVQPTDYEKLTLYTCYPFRYLGRTPDRYVVTCEFVSGVPLSQLLGKDENKQ